MCPDFHIKEHVSIKEAHGIRTQKVGESAKAF